MLQKIKDALNNSILWLLALIGAVLFFWKKERVLQDELQEVKANDTIKNAQDAVKEADSNASDAELQYSELREQFLKQHKDD